MASDFALRCFCNELTAVATRSPSKGRKKRMALGGTWCTPVMNLTYGNFPRVSTSTKLRFSHSYVPLPDCSCSYWMIAKGCHPRLVCGVPWLIHVTRKLPIATSFFHLPSNVQLAALHHIFNLNGEIWSFRVKNTTGSSNFKQPIFRIWSQSFEVFLRWCSLHCRKKRSASSASKASLWNVDELHRF